jgi:hypothetical protein
VWCLFSGIVIVGSGGCWWGVHVGVSIEHDVMTYNNKYISKNERKVTQKELLGLLFLRDDVVISLKKISAP